MTDAGMVEGILKESIRAKEDFLADGGTVSGINRAAETLIGCYRRGGKVIVFGNGGSAADSQHMAAELVGRFERERKALPCVALSANASSLTAIGNDYGFDKVFSRQIEALIRPGDVAVAISTSGNSPNVIEGARAAKKNNVPVIALAGRDGGILAGMADVPIVVKHQNTARIQEVHILIIHILCKLTEDALGRDDDR